MAHNKNINSSGLFLISCRSHVAQGGEPSVKLAPGQETSIQVSFGRKDNIIGSIPVG